jgi:hypothetical protein
MCTCASGGTLTLVEQLAVTPALVAQTSPARLLHMLMQTTTPTKHPQKLEIPNAYFNSTGHICQPCNESPLMQTAAGIHKEICCRAKKAFTFYNGQRNMHITTAVHATPLRQSFDKSMSRQLLLTQLLQYGHHPC